MKVIGRGANGSHLCELSREEMDALLAPRWDDGSELAVGEEFDVLKRLMPTLKFEQSRSAIPHMAAAIRGAADLLEKAFEGK